MGVWMIGTGNITVKPQVDADLIREYIMFSKSCFPAEYGDEYFANTWFFDEMAPHTCDFSRELGAQILDQIECMFAFYKCIGYNMKAYSIYK